MIPEHSEPWGEAVRGYPDKSAASLHPSQTWTQRLQKDIEQLAVTP